MKTFSWLIRVGDLVASLMESFHLHSHCARQSYELAMNISLLCLVNLRRRFLKRLDAAKIFHGYALRDVYCNVVRKLARVCF